MPPATTPIRKLLRQHWPLAVVMLPCLLVACGGDAWGWPLRYDRTAILHGQVWRLLTGNFVHLGAGHLLEDMAGLVLLWLLFAEVLPGWRMPLVILAGCLAVGVGLLLGNPHLEWYVGISGALDTLWMVGALGFIRRRDRFGWVLMGFLLAKLAYEQLMGPLPLSNATTGGTVVVDAHLYGALMGALLGFGEALPWGRIMRRFAQSGVRS